MDSLPEDAGAGPVAVLSRFRRDVHSCFTARADELSELADAVVCAAGPVRSLAPLSLVAEHRRGHGAVYDAVNHGRISIARLRRSLAGLPLPRAADGRLMLAVDVSNWLRPGAATSPQLGQPPALTAAYAATVRSLIAVIATLNDQVAVLQGQVEAHFGQHPDAEIYLSQPGLGAITGARVLGEFGDDPHRYACAKARRNYAATSPITRASGKKKIVAARFVHNGRLIDALMIQAFAALRASPGARRFYDDLRARGIEHNDALRRLANRLVGILHGCLKTRTCYDEATAWGHRENTGQSPVAA